MRDMREERGKEIADSGNVKKVTDHSFKVKSQSEKGAYEVKATPNGMTCTCPDFVYRGGKCKHIQATRYYLEIEKDTPQGTVTEKVHLTYSQAWNAYNEAQKAEVNLFDDLLKDLESHSRARSDYRKTAPVSSGDSILRDPEGLFTTLQPPRT